MKKEFIITADGSHTIAIAEKGLTYHSRHGAIQESLHVFIEAGLSCLMNKSKDQPIKVFEMGFGTGLNAFLTAIKAIETKTKIHYITIEASPLSVEEAALLNYPDALGRKELFLQIHECRWNEKVELNEYFTIEKAKIELTNFSTDQRLNLIYYDAFPPSAQPELWTKAVFEKLFKMLEPNGILVTYCSKADVRRDMMAAGFSIEKLPGPRGKREMVRAVKVDLLIVDS